MAINKFESAVTSLFSDFLTRTKFLCLMLVSVTMIFASVAVQADMIFDFQMKMAQKGDTGAQYKVGEMYETGFGVEQDLTEAQAWITKAAGSGHETATFKLLYWDLEKNGMTKANKAKIEALKTKAENNNPQALYYLGRMYSRGVGVKRNTSNAENWLNKAALAGVPEAESELVVVRERQLKQQSARLADEKKRAELKARQERERQAKLEQQKRLNAQRQAQKQAEEKARADEVARQDAITESRRKENKLANEKSEKARLLKVEQTQQREAEIAAQQQALKQKQAAKQKAEKQKAAKQKASFESDPCSGKSARFLSTCK